LSNIIRPQPGPQTDFMRAEHKFVFMGGGAGGKCEPLSATASLERNL